MILAALVAAQMAADTLAVRGVQRDTVLHADAALVAAEPLLRHLGGAVRPGAAPGRFTLELPGAAVEVADGIPFARHGSAIHPLAVPPAVRHGALWVPLQLATDLAPRLATGLLYDRAVGELRVFSASLARARERSAAASGAAPAAATRAAAPTPAPARVPPSPRRGVQPRVVVIDAGHGGPDPGMRGTLPDGRAVYEKDITLGVARRVAERLRADGVEAVMTRDRDTLIALSDRGRIATRRRGDLFISIHVNAANPRWTNAREARGFETYFLSDAKTDDDRRVAEIENEVVKYETDVAPAGPDDPLGFILGDMLQNEYLRESAELAATVQAALARVHPGADRGVKQAGFRVLVTSFMPSVLVELGFGTNPSEAAYLASARGQAELADAIAAAALEYLALYDLRRASAGGTR